MSSLDIKLWNRHGSYLFEVLFRLHPDLNSESVYKTQRDPAGGEKLFFSYDVDCLAS